MQDNLTTAVLIILLGLSQAAWSKPPKGSGPPPEAVETCAGLNEGDSVSFETPRGDTLEASCQLIKEQLVAVPNNHKRRKQ